MEKFHPLPAWKQREREKERDRVEEGRKGIERESEKERKTEKQKERGYAHMMDGQPLTCSTDALRQPSDVLSHTCLSLSFIPPTSFMTQRTTGTRTHPTACHPPSATAARRHHFRFHLLGF